MSIFTKTKSDFSNVSMIHSARSGRLDLEEILIIVTLLTHRSAVDVIIVMVIHAALSMTSPQLDNVGRIAFPRVVALAW